MNEKLYAAFEYAQRGWHVVPLLPKTKRPEVKWTQYQHESPTEADLHGWFATGDSNVGVITGRASGLVVVDTDSAEATGEIRRLLDGDTLRVSSSRGEHFYFRHPTDIDIDIANQAKLLPEVDVRANGGYVVAPPSTHPDGHRYSWINAGTPIVDLPQSLRNMLTQPREAPVRTTAEGLIYEGARNSQLTKIAGAVARNFTSSGSLADHLLAVNQANCVPPLDVLEVQIIAKSIFTRERGERQSLHSIRLSEFEPEPIEWLWPGHLAIGHMTMIDGQPGEGKSLLAIDLIARVTRGREWPDGSPSQGPSDVVMIKPEDHTSSVVLPRLLAAGADVERIHLIGQDADSVRFPDDFEAVAEQIRAIRPSLVVIDPLTMVIGSGLDANTQADMIAVLHPLRELAREVEFAQLTTRHTKKNTSLGAMSAGVGSFVQNGIARAVFLLGKHPNVEGVRVLAATKTNLSQPPRSRALEYVERNGQPVVEWREAVAFSADDLATMKRGTTARDKTCEFLTDLLSQHPEGLPVCDTTVLLHEAGFAKRTSERARGDDRFERFQKDVDGQKVQMIRLKTAKLPPVT